jgi:predicted GIY-YIG superfamily endonuclease
MIYLPLEEICANKQSCIKLINSKYIIYFLFQDDKLIYIGKTTSLFSRLSGHKGDKRFNYISILEVSKEEYKETEIYYINKYKPECNISLIHDSWLEEILHKGRARRMRYKNKKISHRRLV